MGGGPALAVPPACLRWVSLTVRLPDVHDAGELPGCLLFQLLLPKLPVPGIHSFGGVVRLAYLQQSLLR